MMSMMTLDAFIIGSVEKFFQEEEKREKSVKKSPREKTQGFPRLIKLFNELIGKLNGLSEQAFDVTAFFKAHGLNKNQSSALASLVLKFQDLFKETLKEDLIVKKSKKGRIFLEIGEKPKEKMDELVKINLSENHVKQINDIVYLFRHVKKGRPIELSANGNGFVKQLKALIKEFPHLFTVLEGYYVYPTPLCLEFGAQVLMYKKMHKEMNDLTIKGHDFVLS